MRKRLLLLTAATTSMVLIAFLIPLAILIRNIAEDRAVTSGLREAQNVAAVAAAVSNNDELASVVQAVNDRSDRRTTILLADGTMIGPKVDPDDPGVELARSGRSLTVATNGGREILVPVLNGQGRTAVVRTYVPEHLLHQGALAAILILVAIGVGLLLVALLVAHTLARRTARPVYALAETAHRLARGELDARAPLEGPGEVVEVGMALNRLARQIGELLDHERESVADLSHRLRTPVAALRLAVDALPPSQEADRLAENLDDLQRTVDEVIREARRPVHNGIDVTCDVVSVVADRVAFWTVLAEDQNRPLHLTLPPHPHTARIAADDLAAAVDALLENVFAHTKEGTAMSVAVEPETDGGVRVVVADSGPGLPRRTVVRRGQSEGGSTGLGLDIVRRTAESAGGRLELGRGNGGGARIVMHLPAVSE